MLNGYEDEVEVFWREIEPLVDKCKTAVDPCQLRPMGGMLCNTCTLTWTAGGSRRLLLAFCTGAGREASSRTARG